MTTAETLSSQPTDPNQPAQSQSPEALSHIEPLGHLIEGLFKHFWSALTSGGWKCYEEFSPDPEVPGDLYVISSHGCGFSKIAKPMKDPDSNHFFRPNEVEANARVMAASKSLLLGVMETLQEAQFNAQTGKIELVTSASNFHYLLRAITQAKGETLDLYEIAREAANGERTLQLWEVQALREEYATFEGCAIKDLDRADARMVARAYCGAVADYARGQM